MKYLLTFIFLIPTSLFSLRLMFAYESLQVPTIFFLSSLVVFLLVLRKV